MVAAQRSTRLTSGADIGTKFNRRGTELPGAGPGSNREPRGGRIGVLMGQREKICDREAEEISRTIGAVQTQGDVRHLTGSQEGAGDYLLVPTKTQDRSPTGVKAFSQLPQRGQSPGPKGAQ